jgi:hypothetical protein
LRFNIVSISAAFLLLLSGIAQASKPVVAVFEIKNSANVSSEDLLTLYGLIGTELAATGQFSVVPNSDIKRALRDKKAESYNDCYDESCQIEIGKELAAEMTLATSIKKLGRYCIVSMQLYNLRTGASDRGATQRSSCRSDELLEALIRGIGQLTESGRAKTQTKASNAPDRDIGTSEKKWVPSISKEVIVSFSSEPPGAVVLLNGRMLCQATPCTKNAPAGTHEVTIEKEGYFSRTERTLITKGSKIAWKLKPRFGIVTIRTIPKGLEVKVNQSTVGRTPIEGLRLSPGRHEITVNDSCYYTQGKDIGIKAGEEKTLALDMQAKNGALHVRATNNAGEAVEADIMIDGEKAGTTPSTVMVNICAKTVTVKHPKYGRWSEPSNVEARETSEVMAHLKPQRAAPTPPPSTRYSLEWEGKGRYKKGANASVSGAGCAHARVAPRAMLDTKTNSVWQLRGHVGHYTDLQAEAYCGSLRAGEFSDWRLPTYEEVLEAATGSGFFSNTYKPLAYLYRTTSAQGGNYLLDISTRRLRRIKPPGYLNFKTRVHCVRRGKVSASD